MQLFGISAKATVGKDTFFKQSADLLQSKGYSCRRLSFADCLKNELFDFCLHNYKINPFTDNADEKRIIRDILIAHGTIKRKISNGKYWIDQLSGFIPSVRRADFVFITDVRFKEYEFDEIDFISSQKGKTIYLNNDDIDFCGPERENLPRIKDLSDYIIEWPRMSKDEMNVIIREFWKEYL